VAVHAVAMMLFSPDASRYLAGPELSLATAASVFIGAWASWLLFITVAAASLKKTAIGLALIVSLAIPLARVMIVSKRRQISGIGARRALPVLPLGRSLSGGAALAISIAFSLAVAVVFTATTEGGPAVVQEKVVATLTRFSEGDPVREQVAEVSREMLSESFPSGIGYKNFGYLTSERIRYTTRTLSGDVVSGVSLHNAFLHFAIEGGLIVVAIVVALYALLLRTLWLLLRHHANRDLVVALSSWVGCSVVFGLFHQLHDTVYFLGLFGFVFGCKYRVKRAWQTNRRRSDEEGEFARDTAPDSHA
jgi:hypothetical protein